LHGYDERLHGALADTRGVERLALGVPLSRVSLEECATFAAYLINMTSAGLSFTGGPHAVGGARDVVAITPATGVTIVECAELAESAATVVRRRLTPVLTDTFTPPADGRLPSAYTVNKEF
jgi:glutamate formiminotransferase